jgi:hypothetical protein
MSTLAIVLIAIAAVVLLLLIGGVVLSRRRVAHPDYLRKIEAADRALEHARATDRGWDRALLEQACQTALRAERPDLDFEAIDLVLVDDRPGVVDDRAHLIARGRHGKARVILGRREGGDWAVERIE